MTHNDKHGPQQADDEHPIKRRRVLQSAAVVGACPLVGSVYAGTTAEHRSPTISDVGVVNLTGSTKNVEVRMESDESDTNDGGFLDSFFDAVFESSTATTMASETVSVGPHEQQEAAVEEISGAFQIQAESDESPTELRARVDGDEASLDLSFMGSASHYAIDVVVEDDGTRITPISLCPLAHSHGGSVSGSHHGDGGDE